jgi:hypothetical protein
MVTSDPTAASLKSSKCWSDSSIGRFWASSQLELKTTEPGWWQQAPDPSAAVQPADFASDFVVLRVSCFGLASAKMGWPYFEQTRNQRSSRVPFRVDTDFSSFEFSL